MFDRALAWLLTVTLTTLCATAWSATNPGAVGGSGTLTLGGEGRTCFDTSSKQIPIVCGKPVVHYKITTLMGDPLGNYGLSWQLDGFHIAAAKGHQVKEGTAHRYQPNAIPPQIWEAAQKIELSFYGAALVAGAPSGVALQFNTGASVRPTGKLSLNVPDGYNWEKFLISPPLGSGLKWACVEKALKYVDPAEAKGLMRKGLELQGLQVCQQTTVDVTPVERAIEKFCATNLSHPALFCPKGRAEAAERQSGSDRASSDPFATLAKPAARKVGRTGDSNDPFASLREQGGDSVRAPAQDMGAAFAKAEQERMANVERRRQHDGVTASCQRDITAQERCAKSPCDAEPPKEVCLRSEQPLDTCPPGKRCFIFQSYRCAEHAPNPAHAKWQTCSRDAATACASLGPKITSLASCVTERSKP